MGIRETFGRIKKSVEDKAGEIKQKVQDKESKNKYEALKNLEELIKKLKEKKKTALNDLRGLGLKLDTEFETNPMTKFKVNLNNYTKNGMDPEFVKKLFNKSINDFKELLLAIRKKEEVIQNLQFKINYGIPKYENGKYHTVPLSDITEATKIIENAIKEYDNSISIENLKEKLNDIKYYLRVTQKYIDCINRDFYASEQKF